MTHLHGGWTESLERSPQALANGIGREGPFAVETASNRREAPQAGHVERVVEPLIDEYPDDLAVSFDVLSGRHARSSDDSGRH